MALGNAAGALVSTDTDEDYDQLSFGASGDFGMFGFAVAYQEDSTFAPYFSAENGDFNDSEIIGVSGSASFAGAERSMKPESA